MRNRTNIVLFCSDCILGIPTSVRMPCPHSNGNEAMRQYEKRKDAYFVDGGMRAVKVRIGGQVDLYSVRAPAECGRMQGEDQAKGRPPA